MTQEININKQPILPINQSAANVKAVKQVEKGKVPFQDLLRSQLNQTGLSQGSQNDSQLKFSAHAKQRMIQSGLSFEPTQLEKIADAVKAASQKGSKESLILTQNAALVVSVKNNTVITVLESERMRENVFTNIDSAVIV